MVKLYGAHTVDDVQYIELCIKEGSRLVTGIPTRRPWLVHPWGDVEWVSQRAFNEVCQRKVAYIEYESVDSGIVVGMKEKELFKRYKVKYRNGVPVYSIAEVLLHSVNEETKEPLITYKLTLWKILLAEFNTHRTFSRNAASSRAVPTKKMRARVRKNPYMPFHWGRNQKGMQADIELTGWRLWLAKFGWRMAAKVACFFHWLLELIGLHKQNCNRIIEPWLTAEIIASSTSDGLQNFWRLRNHKDAQPDLMLVAKASWILWNVSSPKTLKPGEWHIPLILPDEESLPIMKQLRISAARCARVSYYLPENPSQISTWDKDLSICKRLMGSQPFHACYDSETEVFTARGWVKWPDVKEWDRIAVVHHLEDMSIFDKDNSFIEDQKFGIIFEKPSQLHTYDYKGKMYRIKHRDADLLVTPEHDVFVVRRTKGGFHPYNKYMAKDIFNKSFRLATRVIQPSVHFHHENLNEVGYVHGLLYGLFLGDGYVVNDGSVDTIEFYVKKDREISTIKTLLLSNQLGKTSFTYVENSDGSVVFRVKLRDLPKEYISLFTGSTFTELINNVIFQWSLGFRVGVVDGLVNTYGSFKCGVRYFSTSSRSLADSFVRLCTTVGIYAKENKEQCKESGNPNYRIMLLSRSAEPIINNPSSNHISGYNDSWEDYDGKVYCASVSTGLLLVRRNGCICISGNSPFEHQAEAQSADCNSGNFRNGWKQHREYVERKQGNYHLFGD